MQTTFGPFGYKQILKETPAIIKRLQNAFNFFCGGVAVFLPWVASKGHMSAGDLVQVLGLVMLGINTLAVMFGVPPTSTTASQAAGQ
jgi:hypothetical protein